MIIKCKMCGGDIQFNQGDTVGQCDYCGGSCTIPKIDEEQKINRYNRANNYRRQCDYDKAIATYEHILEEDDTDAEAHWGIVLSRYGIEYVEDPVSKKRVPTCHRVQMESVLADPDYQAALKNAPDTMSRDLYEQQAKEIAEIQKGILAISENEEPYDVFICYKETDENGKRTLDSSIANDIYYQLTNAGYKVFYAAITLEDKLGTEYEPYIFSALNSARVMLCVGTKPEYFQAVWVKNEWSRYLKLTKTDRSKKLIPCYRDMDAYELPEEFSHLQAQDMSKIGFITDLVRGIQKVIVKDNAPETTAVAGAGKNASQSDALLRRAYICLEDSEWDKADDLAEQILNTDPENAEAYLIQLMSKLKVGKKEDLSKCEEPFDNMREYQRVLRFGNQQVKDEVSSCNEAIKQRNLALKNDEILDRARAKIDNGSTAAEVHEGVLLLNDITGWKDADELAENGKKKEIEIENSKIYVEGKKLANNKEYDKAIDCLQQISGWKDVDSLIEEYKQKQTEKIEAERAWINNKLYMLAETHMNNKAYRQAVDCLEQIPGWRDADSLLEECRQKVEEQNKKDYEKATQLMLFDDEEKLKQAIMILGKLGDWKDAEQKLDECKSKLEKVTKEKKEKALKAEKENTEKYNAYCKDHEEKKKALTAKINESKAAIDKKLSKGKITIVLKYFLLLFGAVSLGMGIKTIADPAFVFSENGKTSPVVVIFPLAIICLFFGIKGIVKTSKIKQQAKKTDEMARELAALGEPMTYEEYVKKGTKH